MNLLTNGLISLAQIDVNTGELLELARTWGVTGTLGVLLGVAILYLARRENTQASADNTVSQALATIATQNNSRLDRTDDLMQKMQTDFADIKQQLGKSQGKIEILTETLDKERKERQAERAEREKERIKEREKIAKLIRITKKQSDTIKGHEQRIKQLESEKRTIASERDTLAERLETLEHQTAENED